MKKSYILMILAVAALLPVNGFSAGGPDSYGYTWKTSLDAGGPAVSWIDITTRPGVQSVTGLADDNSAASMLNIGFNFHYYWNDYSQLKVGSNGWLSFNNVSNIASCFPTIPAAGGPADNYLAPLMGDLNFTGTGNPGQVKYWTNNIDSCIISYINVPFWSVNAPGWVGSNSFQVVLCSSDSSVTYQYGTLGGFVANAACTDLTIGIENSTGSIGLQVHSDAMPPSSYAIKFYYPAVVLLAIQDALPLWNANTENRAEFILKDYSYSLVSSFRNSGNTNITTPLSLQATMLNAASTTVHTSTGNIPSLAAGDDSVFTYPASWTPTAAGQYTFRSELSNSQDINAANNINNTELDVVDGCAPSMVLSYVSGNAPSGSLNWNGGASDDGAAVYFKPPVYPYSVTALQYYISSNTGNGFIAQVYDDDGLNGAPGTLLFTTTVNSASIISAAWNTVTVSPAVTLNSGGFYVVWLQTGTSIFLGNETTGPFSHRNYEILDGAWATYRSDGFQDLCIRASVNGYSALPAAAYTASASALNVSFTNSSTGMASSWAWDFGDGQASTQQSPSHTYAAAGTYNVCLIAASPCGNDTTCQTVTVCSLPTAAYSYTASTLSVTFSDLSTGSADSFAWDFGDGNVSTLQNPVHTYAADGIYTVCLITGSSCGDHDTVCQSVSVCGAIAASYAYTGNLLNVSFTDNSTVTAVSWTWDFGDGNTSTLQNPSHAYASGGTYNVCLIASSSCAHDTVCQTVTVCGPVAAGYTYSGNLLNVSFSDGSTGTVASWTWDFGDGNTNTSQNPSHLYAAAGIYNVCLAIANSCGDTSVSCQQIVVCGASAAAFNIANTADSVFVSDQSTGTIVSWAWDFGDGNVSTQQNASNVYAADGVYTICLTTVDTCGNADTTCQAVTIVTTSVTDIDKPVVSTYPNPAGDKLNIVLQRNLQNAVVEIVDVTGKSVWTERNVSTELVSVDVSALAPGLYFVRVSSAQNNGTIRFIKE